MGCSLTENLETEENKLVTTCQPLDVEAQTLTLNSTFAKGGLEEVIDMISEDEVPSEETEKMENENLELRLPSLEDVQEIKMSETPLSAAKELFYQCKYLLESSNNCLTNKKLKLINEIGIKLMEMLDSLCSASDEKKT